MQRSSGTRSPIAWAEYTHQQRGGSNRRWGAFRAIQWLALVAAVLAGGALAFAHPLAGLLDAPLGVVHSTAYAVHGAMTFVLLVMLLLGHLLIASQALQTAAGSIAREQQARTWESLVLTGMDARQIVVGKWWASVRTTWQSHRRLLVLRILVVLWLNLTMVYTEPGTAFTSSSPVPLRSYAPSLPIVITTLVISLIYPLVNIPLGAGIGMVASALSRGEAGAYRLANGLHFLLLLVLLTSIYVFAAAWSVAVDLTPQNTLWLSVWISPLEGGTLAIVALIVNTGADDKLLWMVPSIVGTLIAYGLGTAALLRLAQAIVVWQKATPAV